MARRGRNRTSVDPACTMAFKVVVVVTCLLVAFAAPAGARSAKSARAAAATKALAREFKRDLGAPLTKTEKRCLKRALRKKGSVAKAIVRGKRFNSLSTSDQVDAVRVILPCTGDALSSIIVNETSFGDVELAAAEGRCIVTGLGELDSSVVAALIAGDDFEALDAPSQAEVIDLVLACAPATFGKVMVAGIAEAIGFGDEEIGIDDDEYRCIGEGIATAIDASAIIGFAEDQEPSPEQSVAMLRVMTDCAPAAMTSFLAEAFTQNGLPGSAAECLAQKVVDDPELVELVARGTGSDTPPPEFVAAVRACT